MPDQSNGWEQVAQHFIAARNPRIGGATVRTWSATIPAGGSLLDLGCGHGVPISEALLQDGFQVMAWMHHRGCPSPSSNDSPNAHAECCAVEDFDFSRREFDGVIAWRLLFLLSPGAQAGLIHNVARALRPGGKFLFTAPQDAVTWTDSLTGRESRSLGPDSHLGILQAAGLELMGEQSDEGESHYYLASKPKGDRPGQPAPSSPAGVFATLE